MTFGDEFDVVCVMCRGTEVKVRESCRKIVGQVFGQGGGPAASA